MSSEKKDEKKTKKRKLKEERMKKIDVMKNFEKKQKEDKEVIELDKHLRKKGFKSCKKEEGYFGSSVKIEDEGKIAFLNIEIMSYVKENSPDAACIQHIELLSFENSKTHTVSLFASNADKNSIRKLTDKEKVKFFFDNIEEFEFDKKDLKVKKAKSMVTCQNLCILENYILQIDILDVIITILTCLITSSGTGWFYFLALIQCLLEEGVEWYFRCWADCLCCTYPFCNWIAPGDWCWSWDYSDYYKKLTSDPKYKEALNSI